MEEKGSYYNNYTKLLKKELTPAMGCTEPIAVAYASSKARQILDNKPEKIKVKCNANIIKNANGVTVPNSGNLKGIKAAAILGAIGGNPDKKLKVLTDIGENEIKLTKSLLKTDYCNIELIESKKKLHIIIEVSFGEEITQVEVVNGHLNIIEIIKNGEIIFNKQKEGRMANEFEKIKDSLKVENIINYAENIDLEEVRIILQRQINLNKNISQEGLNQEYGLNIGSTILRYEEDSTKNRAKSAAAAASDARMSGSFLPVIINSGSGNQGITVSLPVVEYAKDLGVKSPKLLRALIISNLISIHLKHKIGILSAFCGAVTAAAGSGAAITYLCGGGYKKISHTIINTLGNVSGIICDGAKPSCAAKIASSVDAAILGHKLAMDNKAFGPNEGIIKNKLEETIKVVGEIGSKGMEKTNKVILKTMLQDK